MKRHGILMAMSALLIWSCGDDDNTKTDGQVVADSGPDAMTPDMAATDLAVGDGGGSDVGGSDVGVGVDSASTGFTATVQPIFTTSCSSSNCHGGGAPKAGMDLTAGKAYAALVGVASLQCSSLKRVEASAPNKSYLVQKVEGAGSCFKGNKMPVGGSLSTAQIGAIKAWIAAGAVNN